MAASYGVLPQVILNMPFVALRRLMQSYNRRQRRDLKMQAAIRGLDGIGLFSGASGGRERQMGPTDVNIEQTFGLLQAQGFPVEER